MNKIFLSHRSKDKPYVSYIANQFGKDHCVYDEVYFEVGMRNIDEIFREMDKSSIFVVFSLECCCGDFILTYSIAFSMLF